MTSCPASPTPTGREMTVVSFLDRALRSGARLRRLAVRRHRDRACALTTVAGSAARRPGAADRRRSPRVARRTGGRHGIRRARGCPGPHAGSRSATRSTTRHRPDHRRSWLLLSLVTATVRGIDRRQPGDRPRGFRAHQRRGVRRLDAAPRRPSRCAGVLRWCAACTTWCSAMRTATPSDPRLAAGVSSSSPESCCSSTRARFFWKMTAGMGDVVIAPLYQALRRRGVRVRVLPPRRRTASGHRPAGRRQRSRWAVRPTRRRGRRLRTADDGRRPAGLPRSATGRADHRRRRTATLESHFGERARCRNPGAAPGRRLRPRRAWPSRWAWSRWSPPN